MAGIVGALVLVVAGAIAWTVEWRWFAGVRPVPSLSIAVLPFANPGEQHFADGITEDVTTDLSRLADMRVISHDTAFAYKNKPVSAKRIGREPHVRYVLEGSVQRSGGRVRINVQLIDTATDTHLWAERFDRDIGDLLALQKGITGRVGDRSEFTNDSVRSVAAVRASRRARSHPPGSVQNIQAGVAAELCRGDHRARAGAGTRSATCRGAKPARHRADEPRTRRDERHGERRMERAKQLIEQALATKPDSLLARAGRHP